MTVRRRTLPTRRRIESSLESLIAELGGQETWEAFWGGPEQGRDAWAKIHGTPYSELVNLVDGDDPRLEEDPDPDEDALPWGSR